MENNDLQNIQAEFSKSDEAKYIHRLHGVFLVLNGLSTVKAGKLLNEPQRTVADWAKRYKEGGLEAIKPAIKNGRTPVLTLKQETLLAKATSVSPRRYSLREDQWTGELVIQFLKNRFDINMTIRNGRRILRKLKPETAQR